MRIAIATDAWVPQINGVVRTLTSTVNELMRRGYEVELIVPDDFLTVPLPGYAEIRVALAPRVGTRRTLNAFQPDVVHIVTEGPIGWSARRWCLDRGVPLTSAFHTRFPDYAAVRTGLSPEWFWPIMRHFHAPSRAIFVSTERLCEEIAGRGLRQGRLWSRGIDASLFHSNQPCHPAMADLPRPIALNVGRVAAEKNIMAFLDTPMAGSKVVVGDGPALAALRQRYPDTCFLGALHGPELASAYASADVFAFPSRTDTFGLVMIEALASGLPVAGYPVLGPLDIVGVDGRGPDGTLARPVGALDEDLGVAIQQALKADRTAACVYGHSFDWQRCTDQFVDGLRESCRMGLTGRVSTIAHA
jgi:glycosyltransferase involved in cell wall biosynthesis